MIKSQKGFTLIELVMIIVILGILAAVAVPKYVDMQSKAKDAAANGVWGAAQAAAAIHFANNRVNSVTCPTGCITDGTDLLTAMDGTPAGWVVGANTLQITTTGYTITVTAEVDTQKAQLTGGPW